MTTLEHRRAVNLLGIAQDKANQMERLIEGIDADLHKVQNLIADEYDDKGNPDNALDTVRNPIAGLLRRISILQDSIKALREEVDE